MIAVERVGGSSTSRCPDRCRSRTEPSKVAARRPAWRPSACGRGTTECRRSRRLLALPRGASADEVSRPVARLEHQRAPAAAAVRDLRSSRRGHPTCARCRTIDRARPRRRARRRRCSPSRHRRRRSAKSNRTSPHRRRRRDALTGLPRARVAAVTAGVDPPPGRRHPRRSRHPGEAQAIEEGRDQPRGGKARSEDARAEGWSLRDTHLHAPPIPLSEPAKYRETTRPRCATLPKGFPPRGIKNHGQVASPIEQPLRSVTSLSGNVRWRCDGARQWNLRILRLHGPRFAILGGEPSICIERTDACDVVKPGGRAPRSRRGGTSNCAEGERLVGTPPISASVVFGQAAVAASQMAVASPSTGDELRARRHLVREENLDRRATPSRDRLRGPRRVHGRHDDDRRARSAAAARRPVNDLSLVQARDDRHREAPRAPR